LYRQSPLGSDRGSPYWRRIVPPTRLEGLHRRACQAQSIGGQVGLSLLASSFVRSEDTVSGNSSPNSYRNVV